MIENQERPMINDVDRKYELALEKVGGRFKLTSILIQRLKQMRQSGVKQTGSFNMILEPLLDEILEGRLTWEGANETKRQQR
jgi:hypothetical protein